MDSNFVVPIRIKMSYSGKEQNDLKKLKTAGKAAT